MVINITSQGVALTVAAVTEMAQSAMAKSEAPEHTRAFAMGVLELVGGVCINLARVAENQE